jgi:hypothetical protein
MVCISGRRALPIHTPQVKPSQFIDEMALKGGEEKRAKVLS